MRFCFYFLVVTFLAGCELSTTKEKRAPGTIKTSGPKKNSQITLRGNDSIFFRNAWMNFVSAIINKDSTYIKQESFTQVSCVNCNTTNDTSLNFCVPIATFIHDAFKWGEEEWFRSAVSSEAFYYSKTIDANWFSCERGTMEVSDCYEVSFVTLKPNEAYQGHEGAGAVYKFRMNKGRFTFYQMFTVP